jgi:hypothetical protein
MTRAYSEYLGPSAMVIGDDPGGDQIYLQMSDEIPSVWYWMHEEEGSIKLADDFGSFIDRIGGGKYGPV